jgi:hypothetical protein
LQDRSGVLALGVGDVIDGAECNRCQLVDMLRNGKPFDFGVPTRGEHRDAKVIEHRTTTDDRLSTRIVCARDCSVPIDEQA